MSEFIAPSAQLPDVIAPSERRRKRAIRLSIAALILTLLVGAGAYAVISLRDAARSRLSGVIAAQQKRGLGTTVEDFVNDTNVSAVLQTRLEDAWQKIRPVATTSDVVAGELRAWVSGARIAPPEGLDREIAGGRDVLVQLGRVLEAAGTPRDARVLVGRRGHAPFDLTAGKRSADDCARFLELRELPATEIEYALRWFSRAPLRTADTIAVERQLRRLDRLHQAHDGPATLVESAFAAEVAARRDEAYLYLAILDHAPAALFDAWCAEPSPHAARLADALRAERLLVHVPRAQSLLREPLPWTDILDQLQVRELASMRTASHWLHIIGELEHTLRGETESLPNLHTDTVGGAYAIALSTVRAAARDTVRAQTRHRAIRIAARTIQIAHRRKRLPIDEQELKRWMSANPRLLQPGRLEVPLAYERPGPGQLRVSISNLIQGDVPFEALDPELDPLGEIQDDTGIRLGPLGVQVVLRGPREL